MITLTADPNDPSRLIVTQAVTLYLDRVLLETLSDELAKAISTQARKDLQNNTAVKKIIAKAATEKLLAMLGVTPEEKPNV